MILILVVLSKSKIQFESKSQQIKSANVQKVDEVVIRLKKEYNREEITEGILTSLQKGRATTIKKIIIIDKNGKFEEFDADQIRRFLRK